MTASAGGSLSLQFGEKLPMPRPLRNKHLTEEERTHEGELTVFLSCAWRLDGVGDILAVWSDPTPTDSPLPLGTECIKGTRVVSARVAGPAYDLELQFEGDRWLKAFCDQPISEEVRPNYTASIRKSTVVVGSRGKLTVEP